MADSTSSPAGPVRQIFLLIITVLLILYLGKIYLRDPEYRNVEVCYLPYKIAHLFWVDVWGAVVTEDTSATLKHSRDVNQFFSSCTKTVGKQEWLRTFGTNQQPE
tara:strand:+ start:34379 stop:34693 length:315 start_codon:yes stop_codon:yes gene_type:complete